MLDLAVMIVLMQQASTAPDAQDVTRYLRGIVVEKGKKAGDVICTGCSIRVEGEANGDAIALGGDIEISGTLHGDAIALGGRVRILKGGRAEGDVTVIGGGVEAAPGAVVSGEPDTIPYVHVPGQRSLHPSGVLVFIAGNVLLALIGGVVLRGRAEKIGAALVAHPLWTAGAGCAACAALLLLLGLPGFGWRWIRVLDWIGIAALLVAVYFGCVGVAAMVGGAVRPKSGRALRWILGAGILSVGMLAPVVGAAVFVALLVFGSGAVLVSGFGRMRRGAAGSG